MDPKNEGGKPDGHLTGDSAAPKTRHASGRDFGPGQGRVPADADFSFRHAYYQLTGYVLAFLTKVLKVNIQIHAETERIAEGDIFLFNHFARFETFIPPYLIYKHTGMMSHSIASAEFFHGNNASSRLLKGLGAVPNDYPNIFPFLAAEIIRGGKVIVFPEGGMVKDRRVVDRMGRFGVYSRTAHERRKHHAGAAVIAEGLEVFREAVLRAKRKGNDRLLQKFASDIGENGREKLLSFVERPINVVPANITFYPIRVDPNLLERWAEMIAGGGGISERLKEELRIEGNILLKDTDMDIRLGPPSSPGEFWNALDRAALEILLSKVDSIEDAFDLLKTGCGGAMGDLVAKRARSIVFLMRDRYMRDIYSSVSVNLSQVASSIIYWLLDEGRGSVKVEEYNRMLYMAVKKLQPHTEVALHRSLVDPDIYSGVEEGLCPGVREYVEVAKHLGLVEEKEGRYNFLEGLTREAEFDHIRIENPVAVYANEVRPLETVTEVVKAAIREEKKLGPARLSGMRFDDEQVAYRFDKFRFSKMKYRDINSLQHITADTRPYFLKPENPLPTGILLIHGFSSSPGEMRPLAEYLFDKGYAVLGVRLKGHGTSPWDLRERTRDEWYASVERGKKILLGHCGEIAMVGFSMGGLLALRHAAEDPRHLTSVVSACAPVKFRDKALAIVEVVHRMNKLVGFVSGDHDLKTFHQVAPENPEINYRHMPLSAIHELNHLAAEVEKMLEKVTVPALVLQADNDPTVEPESGRIIHDKLKSAVKRLVIVRSELHGIVYRNIGGCHETIAGFLAGEEP